MINHFQWKTAQTMRKNTEYFDPYVPYFKEVHDGELILDGWFCVLNSEVIPLCVFVGVQIISKPQLVFSIITMMKK